MLEEIRVKRAAQHNLKHIDVTLPRNRFIVITGPSGSGKSSLAFDTLFAEGQRRYIECLSAYARQYIEQMEKPDVESIEGLSPAISIDQKTISFNPRSTVGTVTEAYDFLRLLFARAGTPHCPRCGRFVSSQTPRQILERLLAAAAGERVKILAPVVKGRKGEYTRLFERFQKKGYLRARVDGRWRDLDEDIFLARTRSHDIEILVDEIDVRPELESRLKEAVDLGLELADGDLLILREDGEEMRDSLNLLCPYCEISLMQPEPRAFSFNSPYGACSVCHGLGFRTRINHRGEHEVTDELCTSCRGSRLQPEALAVKVGGHNIFELSSLPVDRLIKTFGVFSFTKAQEAVVSRIRREILSRLEVIKELGMGYLQLSRTTASLSGGEARRIRLAAQVGSRLRGVLYVLDEPTIGLHQRDNGRLIALLRNIRDHGNSIVVVEHDEQTIRSADFILDLGPGAGEKGGEKVAEGGLDSILAASDSLTAQYLSGVLSIPVPRIRRRPAAWLTVEGAKAHNLKNIDVRFPLSVMTAVTGVSGSGKSTLIYDILFRSLANLLHQARHRPGEFRAIRGAERIDKIISVDQKPIGRTPRSNPATFTGLFTPLRQLFALTPEARSRGYTPSRFSFNLPGGRCEECQGAGARKIEMHFLPDVFVTCDRCGGSRYNRETLAVRYKGRSIADYLAMTVDDAYRELKAHPPLRKKLEILKQVGLGYLRLGQPAPTLSGGEAQRIKLTKELSRSDTGRTLYLLDEPTTGLHFDDVRKLLDVLARLVELGNTVIVIEHNLEVIKVSDYIIDLGPEGGEQGGRVIAAGSPESVCGVEGSQTGRFLSRVLASAGHK
jgi:excinuclease ABC subunit A